MEVKMPGDPKECRQHALNCMLLAKRSTTEESRLTFLALSKTWIKLAAEIEAAAPFLKSVSEIQLPDTTINDRPSQPSSR
jgi:hypothetical protein